MEDEQQNGRIRRVEDLGPGDHLCCIYETEEEHRALVTPYLAQGLERGERVMYIVDTHTAEEVLLYLEEEGIETAPLLAGGQLSMLTVSDAYMKGGVFDPEGMIAMLREETQVALAEGYAGLRVTGEMSWALRGLPGSERLMEYEAMLNHFFPGSACLAVCQYDRRLFGPDILLDVITTHPLVVIGSDIYENFYYIPPDEFIGKVLPESTLESRIRNLELHERNLQRLAEREQSLIESRERWQRSFDALGDAMLILDGDLRILQHNTALCELLGMQGDFTGRKCPELVHGKGSPPAFCVCREAIACRKQVRAELYEPALDKHLWVSFSPVFDARGEMEFGVHVLQDISESKRIEEELRESEEKFRSIVEQSGDGIVLVDNEGVIVEWNSAQEGITGLGRERAAGRKIWDVQHLLVLPEKRSPEAYQARRSSILDSLEKGYDSWFGETSESELQSPDGERRMVQAVSFPMRCSEGMMIGTISRDITRRVQMEDALAFEAEVNRAVAELSSALLSQLSIEDISCVVLENARRLTGSRFGYVGYIDSETGRLVSPTLGRDTCKQCEVEDKAAAFSCFSGLWGWVLLNREPLLTNDPQGDPRSTGVPAGHIPIRRFLSVPALLGGALVGQIALANADRDYVQRDLEVITRLADLYAMAVLRMWSEEELEGYREHLEDLVRQRTLELEDANRLLQEEIAERGRRQEELRSKAEQLRALSARLESVREEERRHVSREVHDTLGQILTGLKMGLAMMGKKLAGDAEAQTGLAAMSELADTAIQSVREISSSLRPGMLDDLGLSATLEWQLKRFGEMSGLECTLVSEAEDDSMDKDLAVALFRIAQEALTNVARHADAARVEVRLEGGPEGLTLEVRDDGRGISAEEIEGQRSLGLLGIRERAGIYGGVVEVSGRRGQGTSLTVRIPPRPRGGVEAGDAGEVGA